MENFANRMDHFSQYVNNDSLLAEVYPTGLVGNEVEMDNYLSGENFTFLHQKLSEASSLNASYAQRESHLKCCAEQLKKEKEDISQKCETLLSEQGHYKSKQILLEQKVDSETRQRFLYHDKLVAVEKNLEEEQTHRKTLEEKLKDMQINLTNADSFSKEIYQIAEESTRQIVTLKEEIRVLEEMLMVYKRSFLKVNKENEKLYSELEYVNSQLKGLEETFKEASYDINSFKEENLKHETYINETLNRFKEITVHFGTMKDQFLMQQEALERYHNETGEKSKTINEMKRKLSNQLNEMEEVRKSSSLREVELNKTVEKLQDTLNGLVALRKDLEEKNQSSQNIIDTLRDENIKWKAEVASTKSILSVERNYMAEKNSCVENISVERDEWKERYEDIAKKSNCSQKHEDELKKENEEYNKQKNEMLAEIKSLRNIIDNIEDHNKWISIEKENLTEQLFAKGKEIESCIGEANDVENCLKRRHSELSLLTNDMISIKEEKEKLEKENNGLLKRLDFSMKSEEDLKNKVKEFEDRLIKCQFLFMENDKKYSELDEKCKICEDKNKEDKHSIKTLNEEIQQLKVTCHDHHQTNEELQHELKETKFQLQTTLNDNDVHTKMNNESIKMITSDIRKEIEEYRRECNQKEQTISMLTLKLEDNKIIFEEEKLKLLKANEQVNALQSKGEGTKDTISRISEEKKEYLNIIENFTRKEGNLKKDQDIRLLQIKDLEFLLNEQKREFEQYQLSVDNYNCLWERDREVALKDLQDELSRDHNIFQQLDICSISKTEPSSSTHITHR